VTSLDTAPAHGRRARILGSVVEKSPTLVRRELPGLSVGIVGLGYVGLPTALSLLEAGRSVVGLDVDPGRLVAIRRGEVDLLPQDQDRLARHVGRSGLSLTTRADLLGAVDAVVVCVPTPVDENLVPDLTALRGACAAVVAQARPGQTIVITSTTYVGCTRELIVDPLAERGLRPGVDVHVAFSPERIDPGVAAHLPERTPRVIGGLTPACTERAAAALAGTCPGFHRVSSPEAAELTKLLENSFRAVNIALANEWAGVAGHLGLSVTEVVEAAATKPYGFMPFYPGPGAGGHCIPCDPHYLLWQLRAQRVTAPLLEAAMTGLAGRPRQVVSRVREVLADAGLPVAGARIHVVGVAYKPGVADTRESPALEIMAELQAAGAHLSFSDDLVDSVRLPGGTLRSLGPTGVAADLVLVHTRHPGADLRWLRDHPTVLDATYRLTEVPHRQVV